MAAPAFPGLDLIATLKEWIDLDPGALRPEFTGHGAIAADVDGLHTDVLKTAPGAIERDDVPLLGHEGVQRVTHPRAVAVGHGHVHRVLNVNLGAEDALVTEITVVLLLVKIQFV